MWEGKEQWLARKREQVKDFEDDLILWTSGKIRSGSRLYPGEWKDDTPDVIADIRQSITTLNKVIAKVEAGEV